MLKIDIMGGVRFSHQHLREPGVQLARILRHVAFETVADVKEGAMCHQL